MSGTPSFDPNLWGLPEDAVEKMRDRFTKWRGRPSLPPRLTEKNARNYYWRQPEFQRIVQRIGAPENRQKLMEKIEEELASDQGVILLKRQILLLGYTSISGICAIGVGILLWFFKIGNGLQLAIVLAGIFAVVCFVGVSRESRKKKFQMRRDAAIDKNADALRQAEIRDIELINRIEEEWDEYCINFPGYPPDWKYRRLLVLERDNRTCCECGWPMGFRRRVRLLHVHHKEPLSRKGKRPNALTNLVILCDKCHSKQEGPGHARLNPRGGNRPKADI